MVLKVFSIMDVKAECFAHPFYQQSAGLAIRAFGDVCGDDKMPFKRHPDDFVLYELGEFDDGLGEFRGIPPKAIANARQFAPQN